MDLYTKNGTIIRAHELNAEMTEVEFEFLVTKFEHALLYSITAMYLAFVKQSQIEFVLSSFTRRKAVLHTKDFTPDVQRHLIDAVLRAEQHTTRLLDLADLYFYGEEDKGVVETYTSEALRAYQKTEFVGKKFLEAFADALGE